MNEEKNAIMITTLLKSIGQKLNNIISRKIKAFRPRLPHK